MPTLMNGNYRDLYQKNPELRNQSHLNNGGVSPSSQSNKPTTDVVDLTQTDEASSVTPQVTVTQNRAPTGLQSTQSGAPRDGYAASPNLNALVNMGLDGHPISPELDDSTMVFTDEYEVQTPAQPQQVAQTQQDVRHEQAFRGQQPTQNQQLAEQHSTDGGVSQQALSDDDDLFDDNIYWAERLQHVAEWNARN